MGDRLMLNYSYGVHTSVGNHLNTNFVLLTVYLKMLIQSLHVYCLFLTLYVLMNFPSGLIQYLGLVHSIYQRKKNTFVWKL